jgi:hypothetical protein
MGLTSMRTIESPTNVSDAASKIMNSLQLGGRKKGRHSKGSKGSKGSKKRTKSARKPRRAHSSHRRGVKKGGMGVGFGAVVQEAMVPFGLFAWQKRSQKNKSHHKKSHHYKSRKSR